MKTLRYFYHPDHLGSSSVSTPLNNHWITDGSGNAIQHLHYLPFGEDWVDQRNASWNAPYTFSGKEKDVETGYSYFGARYYDSGLSIWLSVDPMSDKYPNLTPYNYCANNPVILVDPDGREVFDASIMNSKNKNLIEAWEAFVNTKVGKFIVGLYAKEGQTVAGVKFEKSGMFHDAGIDLTLKFDASFSENHGGNTSYEIKNNRLNTIVTLNPDLSVYKIAKNIAHEILIHGMQSAADFHEDRNLNLSNAPKYIVDAGNKYFGNDEGRKRGYVHHYNEIDHIGNLKRYGIPLLQDVCKTIGLKKSINDIEKDLDNFER
jgi:RHS repeat-associated protein